MKKFPPFPIFIPRLCFSHKSELTSFSLLVAPNTAHPRFSPTAPTPPTVFLPQHGPPAKHHRVVASISPQPAFVPRCATEAVSLTAGSRPMFLRLAYCWKPPRNRQPPHLLSSTTRTAAVDWSPLAAHH
ncbi:hypothetical protein SOVF_046770 [Spinacia oleracea]|nr:hypothetical protein SOVF_046770 [Spinacia oleracea]